MRLDVLKPGSSVKIGPKQDISAMILQVRIQEQNYVDYQVVWWSGRERKTEWIGNLEVAGGNWGDELSIGFNN